MSSDTFFLLTCHLATTLQRALALLLVLSWVTYPAKDIIITVQNGFMTESKPQWEISAKVQFSLDNLVKLPAIMSFRICYHLSNIQLFYNDFF